MKVLLADADKENIKNFKNFIKNHFPMFKVVYTMNDNRDPMQELKEILPDLLICDLRFFGSSGYQKIIAIYAEYPDLPIIMYGMYKDSEYIQRCLSYGVVDYMFRPVKSIELERSLHTALKFIENLEEKRKKQETMQIEYERQKVLFENKFLTNVIAGRISKSREIVEGFNYFNIEINASYRVFNVRIDKFQTVILALEERQKHILIYQIHSIVSEKIKEGFRGVAFISSFNMATAIIGGEISLQEAIHLCNEIRLAIKKEVKIGVTIGLGNAYKKETEIADSYSEARAALRYRYMVGYDTVIPIAFVEPNNQITYKYSTNTEKILVATAVIGEYAYCKRLLKKLIESLRNAGVVSKGLVQKITMNIIVSINRYATEQDIQMGNQFTYIFPSKDVFALESLEEAYQYLDHCLKQFCDFMVDYREKIHFQSFDVARDRIIQTYHENISLNEVAREVGTTPDFLNKLFKKYEQKTFYDYLTEIRIEQARRLILQTDLPEDEIALRVGYEDAKYLRSMFRQQTGLNTFELRNLINSSAEQKIK